MSTNDEKQISLRCACGGAYAHIDARRLPDLMETVLRRGEDLFECVSCGSLIGIRPGISERKLAAISVYRGSNQSTSTENAPLADTPSPDTGAGDLSGAEADEDREPGEFDTAVNCHTLKEREVLNKSRINFDLTKNFLHKHHDNSKIQFEIDNHRLICRETEIQEILWTLPVPGRGRATGLYYLDYQMVLLLDIPADTEGQRPRLIDRILESTRGDNSPGELDPSAVTEGLIPAREGEAADLFAGRFAGDERRRILSISGEEEVNLGFSFDNILTQKKSRLDYSLPGHSHFMILDPITGLPFLSREGKLLAHSLGMDFLFFAWQEGDRTWLESVPANDSLETRPFSWRRELEREIDLIVEHDDFLILNIRPDQIPLFETPSGQPGPGSGWHPDQKKRVLVEKKYGDMYGLSPM